MTEGDENVSDQKHINQEFLCAQNRCGDAPEIANAIGHDRLGHCIINALVWTGITTANDVRALDNRHLLGIRRIGRYAIARIRESFPWDETESQ